LPITPQSLAAPPAFCADSLFAKVENELAMFAHGKSMKGISQGLMHQENISSWLIGEQKQDIQPGQQLTGAPALGSGD